MPGNTSPMLKIGHRGAPPVMPENTISSFRKAIALGADGIELDVHLCKSSEPVVIHDDTVERTTDGKGKVSDFTLAELRELHIARGEHIPTLKEVLEALGDDIYCFVEVKTVDAALPTAELISSYVKKGWQGEKLYLVSFKLTALQAAIKEFPQLRIGASFEEQFEHDDIIKAKKLGAHTILPDHCLLTPQHVETAHELGMKVFTWTVNEPSNIRRASAMQVDGIITDYLDRL